MKLLVSLVLFSLLLNGLATAQTLIQDSCKKAAKDPNLKYDFCVTSLTQDPQSKTATTLEGLFLASTKNAAAKTTNVKGIIEQILKDKRYEQGVEAVLRDCVELYNDANDDFNKALASAKSQDYSSANVNLSAALDAPVNCEDGFKEGKQLKSPITNENNILFQKILIPLAFSNML